MQKRTVYHPPPQFRSPQFDATSASPSSNNNPQFLDLDPTKPIYGGFRIYKSRSTMEVAVSRPRLALSYNQRYYNVARTGSMNFSFAPAKGDKEYDYTLKQSIHLSPSELGNLLAFDHMNHNEIKIFHDPNQNTPQAGEICKELIIRNNGPGRGYFFNLVIILNKQRQTPITVAVSDGEWRVVISLIHSHLSGMLAMSPRVIEPLVENPNFVRPENQYLYHSNNVTSTSSQVSDAQTRTAIQNRSSGNWETLSA